MKVIIRKKQLEKWAHLFRFWHLVPDFLELDIDPEPVNEMVEEIIIPHSALNHCPNCVFPPNYNCDCSCHELKSGMFTCNFLVPCGAESMTQEGLEAHVKLNHHIIDPIEEIRWDSDFVSSLEHDVYPIINKLVRAVNRLHKNNS